MSDRIRLSVTVITLNEERNIGRCIDSVTSVADDIVVVDSQSTDRTRAICESKGVRFIEQEFLGYTEQKNFATEQAQYRHVLSLDADESLSPELTREIESAKANWVADGYTMNRFNNYYGRWLRHGSVYPDRKLRLWDREKGAWQGAHVHETIQMQPGATVHHLGADLLHYAYDSIESHVAQNNRFSSLGARAYFEKGRRGSWFALFANPTLRFFRDYFLRMGFLDGFHGLAVSSIDAHMTFLKYAKLRELQQRERATR